MPPTPSTSPALNSVTSSISFSVEQAGEVLGGDRLGEGAVERRRVDELGAVADAALAQVPVGEEGELERRDRALDRHVDEVHDEAAAVEALERPSQRLGAFRVVEGEHALVPAGTGQALGLLGLQAHAGGDHEHVVGEHGAVVEQHLVALGLDLVDLVLMEDDAVVAAGAGAGRTISLELREPERHEEQAGLVDVAVVAVDDVDLGLVRRRSGGAAGWRSSCRRSRRRG